MKFMKAFKMGFNMFALEKMTHPQSEYPDHPWERYMPQKWLLKQYPD